MHHYLARFAGLAAPFLPRVDLAAVARGLGHNTDRCLMRAQGKCPGRNACADCQWSENLSRGDATVR